MLSRRRSGIDDRYKAVGMLQAAVKQIDVAATLSVTKQVYYRHYFNSMQMLQTDPEVVARG